MDYDDLQRHRERPQPRWHRPQHHRCVGPLRTQEEIAYMGSEQGIGMQGLPYTGTLQCCTISCCCTCDECWMQLAQRPYLDAKDGELPSSKGRHECQQRSGHSEGQHDEDSPAGDHSPTKLSITLCNLSL